MQHEDDKHLILLTQFSFPNHWRVQAWLNGTDYGKDFDLVLAEVDVPTSRGSGDPTTSKTTPALRPKTEKVLFYWMLKGDKGVKELEQKILDFEQKNMYS